MRWRGCSYVLYNNKLNELAYCAQIIGFAINTRIHIYVCDYVCIYVWIIHIHDSYSTKLWGFALRMRACVHCDSSVILSLIVFRLVFKMVIYSCVWLTVFPINTIIIKKTKNNNVPCAHKNTYL